MKRAKLLQSFFAVLFLIIFFGCRDRVDVPLETTTYFSNKVSLEAAKKWVVTMTPQLHAQERILWELAEETDFGGVPLLTVPLLPTNNNEQVLMKKDGRFTKSPVSTQRILFYTDAKGNPKASIIKTESSQNNNFKFYTGNLHFFDPISNTLQSVWQLQNGNIIGNISFESTPKNARSTGCTWELYEVVCGDQCTGQLGGADNGDYLPEIGQGCCWKFRGCGSGPSTPSNPSPYTPIFNPNNPIGSVGLGTGGLNGGMDGIHGTSILGSTTILNSETGQPTFDVFEMKVVGEESFNEENDFRLYRNPCDGYRYLIDKARNSNGEREVGGMLTNAGLIVEPNSWGTVGSFFHRFQVFQDANSTVKKLGYRCRIKGQIEIIYINTFFHSHPRGGDLSPKDMESANKYPDYKRYVVFNNNRSISFREYKITNPFLDQLSPEFLNSQSESEFLSNRGCQ